MLIIVLFDVRLVKKKKKSLSYKKLLNPKKTSAKLELAASMFLQANSYISMCI